MSTAARHVFSIPPGSPFLPTLVDALFEGRLVGMLPDDPAALSDITIYVPTRRATRALIALLAERGGAKAQLLPRIVPLGEADEAEFELTGLEGTPLEEAAALKPPIPPLERRLILTRLIQRWSAQVDRTLLQLGPDVPFLVPGSPADAVNLAADLETLMDSFTTEGIDWRALELAVEADFSEYFRITRNFVQIVSEYWPQILAERQASDPAARRGALIEAEARRLERMRPATPMIVAGSTGSIPATANLIAAIARLPRGAVVLPGLDTDLDEDSWRKIGGLGDDATDPTHTHPQATLRRLVDDHLGVARSEIVVLGQPTAAATARTRVLSEALRPAETTDLWSEIPAAERLSLAESGCDGIAVIEATDEREEALAIAVALRETLNDPRPECGPRDARSGARRTGFGRTGALGHRRRGFGRLRPLGYAGGKIGAPRRGRCSRGPEAAAGPGASGASAGAPRMASRRGGACRVRARNRRVARSDPGRRPRGNAPDTGGKSPSTRAAGHRGRESALPARNGIWPTICCGGWSTRSRRFHRRITARARSTSSR